jgi:putative ABC transport system permease protein
MGGSVLNGIPYTWEEGLVIMALVLVLLSIVIIVSVFKKIGIGRDFALGILIGGIQLFTVALFLTFLFGFELWYFLIWVLLVTMVLVGGYISAKRASKMPGAYWITTPAILVGAVVALVVLAVSRAMPMEPQFIVPLAGMAFGNSMAVCSLAIERLIRETRLSKAAIETLLSLGANSKQAIEEYGKLSIRASLIPTIDRLKTLGIIFIPGAMSGLLMAGTDPIVAAEYQIIIFMMIIGGGIITTLLTVSLSRKRLFTHAEQFEDWV